MNPRKAFIECRTLAEAEEKAPWAYWFKKADGGYWAFESITDAEIWEGQK